MELGLEFSLGLKLGWGMLGFKLGSGRVGVRFEIRLERSRG